MKANAQRIGEILGTGEVQFLVPFFQRRYTWKRKHWARLWNDIVALLDQDDNSQHFLGPLVCTPVNHAPGELSRYQLIDGQQRLTSLTILLAVVRDAARALGDEELSATIHEYLLVHRFKKGWQRMRLLPRTGDREILRHIVEPSSEKPEPSNGIAAARRFFTQRVREWTAKSESPLAELTRLKNAVADRTALVVITIDREDPYAIFDSLNSTGEPLKHSDLIRNYIFMMVKTEDQDTFQEEHWQEFESMFEADGSAVEIDQTTFYRNYLQSNGTPLPKHATFAAFKDRHPSGSPVQGIVANMKRFARYEQMLRRPAIAKDQRLAQLLDSIARLDLTVVHPLVMHLMARQDSGSLTADDLVGCLSDIVSFALRRSFCGEDTRQYGRWFVGAIKEITDAPRRQLQESLVKRGWPDDAAFTSGIHKFEVYRRERFKGKLALEMLEASSGHKEPTSLEKLQVEHVMPQTIRDDKNGKAWKAMLGPEWNTVHRQLVHCLGNLTLTGYNSELSNSPFDKKRQLLAESHLEINRPIADLDRWDKAAIESRADQLASRLCKLTPRPDWAPTYKASVDATLQRVGPINRKQLFREYWQELADQVKPAGVSLPMAMIKPRSWLVFKSARPRLRYWTAIELRKRYQRIGVGLTAYGKRAKELFEVLSAHKLEIEQEFGSELLWSSKPDVRPVDIVLWKPVSSVLDTAAWPEQHDWLLTSLKRLAAVMEPRLTTIKLGEPLIGD